MVVDKDVIIMVLERGEERQDVVVKGLQEIALAGKVTDAPAKPMFPGSE